MKVKMLITLLIISIMCSAVPAYAASVEMTDKSVKVADASADDTLIVALYKNNSLVECKLYKESGTYSKNYTEDMASSINKADEVRAFLWNMKTLKPACGAFSSSINDLPAEPSITPTPLPETNEYKIRLTAGGQEFTATLYKNSTTNAIVERLPLTLPMMDLYGNEMCYRFPDALPTDDARTQGYEVGEIMYWPPGHSFVIRYAQNGEHFQMQKLGKLDSGLEFFQSCGDIDVKIELITNDYSDDCALINGGTFTMGSPANEAERDADEIQHNVTVDSFYISKTELTQAEYQSVMGTNPSENKGDNLPVTNVDWYDAILYCNALSEKNNLTPCYTINGKTVTWNKAANGYRLPTEAEWEYAARANTQTPFNFGDYVNDSDANCYNAYGYNNDASGSRPNGYLQHTVNVNNYDTNDYGLYNMHGNVAEWVWDWYGDYNTAAAQNPTGADSGRYKVARGGGWNDFPKHIRSSYRSAFPADVPTYNIGIRVVRNAAADTGTAVSTDLVTDIKPNKTLIVYFSEGGNTAGLANIIQEATGADIFRLERSTDYRSTYAESLTELRTAATPPLKQTLEEANIDISEYDTILLGYCNWWASIPAPIRTFLTNYDLSGKNIIPFCSMGSGRFGQTISAVAKLAPDSVIKQGLYVTYSSYNRTEIGEWLKTNEVIE